MVNAAIAAHSALKGKVLAAMEEARRCTRIHGCPDCAKAADEVMKLADQYANATIKADHGDLG